MIAHASAGYLFKKNRFNLNNQICREMTYIWFASQIRLEIQKTKEM